MNEPNPFVPRHGRVDTNRPPTPDELAECRRLAREGAGALASRAKYVKPPQLTDAESAALARKRADQEATR